MPEHGGFRCDPSPCRGFTHKSIIHFFCEPGYTLPSRRYLAKCNHGRWQPGMPTCIPRPGKKSLDNIFSWSYGYGLESGPGHVLLVSSSSYCCQGFMYRLKHLILHHKACTAFLASKILMWKGSNMQELVAAESNSSAFSMKEMCRAWPK